VFGLDTSSGGPKIMNMIYYEVMAQTVVIGHDNKTKKKNTQTLDQKFAF